MPAFNFETCVEKHRSISWMFGTLISLQLLCFSWLGYLSTRVINIENAQASNVATLSTKVEDIQKQIDRRVDDILRHLDEIKRTQK